MRTPTDVEAFVQCAAEYLAENGPARARRAFHEDGRWKHGSIYVFVDAIAPSGDDALVYVYPPDPSREGSVWGAFIDTFGTDYYTELHRVMELADAGWLYYSIENPAFGSSGVQPKASYVIEVDWNGQRAVIGAGIYQPDLPGNCTPELVNAASLAEAPDEMKLQDFVRCAALNVESKGYVAKQEFETGVRWRHGGTYVFMMDTEGRQVSSGNPLRVNGAALHEFGGAGLGTDQFGGRDIPAVGDAFGEAFVYYGRYDPATGETQPRKGFLKRVDTNGVTLLVGASYDPADEAHTNPTCSDHRVAASGIRTRREVEAFVRCAAEYIAEHGTAEARRAFHHDERWKHGPYYLFVDRLAQPEEEPLSYIELHPGDPSWEGTSQVLIDDFGTDYFHELHRIMSHVDEGWIHYAFTNYETGRSEPKSSYVIEIDWDGHRAVVGAGIYERDLPGNCSSTDVNAAGLETAPSTDRLRAFVRCAALQVGSYGQFAGHRLSTAPRWRKGSIYLFAQDTLGNELFNGAQVGGQPVLELSPVADDRFGGRDVVKAADTFGETFAYYSAINPSTGMVGKKIVFLKRVVVHGIPTIVGGGYYVDPNTTGGTPGSGTGGSGGNGTDDGTSRGDRGRSATLFYWQAPSVLNPYLSRGVKDVEAASLVLEPLAEFNQDGELVPVLATTVPTTKNRGVSADRRRVRWEVRDDVLWSDGTPLTVDDVVYTWQYCSNPATGCSQEFLFDAVEDVAAVDDRIVEITFREPMTYPYGPFVSSRSPILPKHQFSGCEGDASNRCLDQNYMPIGTGPYVVVEFQFGRGAHYEVNPRYRDIESGRPYFTDVHLQGGGDATAAARSVLERGEADYAWNLQIEPTVLGELAANGKGTVVSAFSSYVERLVLNQTNPAPDLGDRRSEFALGTNPHPFLADPVVGRALSLAIDRTTLAETGYGSFAGRPTCNVWPAPAAQASPNNEECRIQDIALARQTLDAAGIVDTDGDGVREREGVPLRILFQTSTNAVRQRSQQLIQGWWREIGVETRLKDIDPTVFFGASRGSPDTIGRFYADVQMYANGGGVVDPEPYLRSWVTSEIAGAGNSFQGNNIPRFQSVIYDRLFSELQSTIDPDMRNRIVIALNDLLVQSYSIIPLVHRGRVSAHANDIKGVRMNPWDSELWNFEEWTRKE